VTTVEGPSRNRERGNIGKHRRSGLKAKGKWGKNRPKVNNERNNKEA